MEQTISEGSPQSAHWPPSIKRVLGKGHHVEDRLSNRLSNRLSRLSIWALFSEECGVARKCKNQQDKDYHTECCHHEVLNCEGIEALCCLLLVGVGQRSARRSMKLGPGLRKPDFKVEGYP